MQGLRGGRMKTEQKGLRYHIGTLGYFVIILRLIGSPLVGWWLIFEGDILTVIHDLKMGLPAWAWITIKYTISLALTFMFIGGLVMLGMFMLWWSNRRQPRS